MNISKFWRSDSERRSRFHNERGVLCADPFELTYASLTCAGRVLFGYWPKVPWLTLGARRMLSSGDWSGCVGFEYSTGGSTSWFGRRLERHYCVESDPEWATKVEDWVQDLPNVTLFREAAKEKYVRSIDKAPESGFDLIAIDGIYREDCFFYSVDRLNPGGYLVIDNTDVSDRSKITDHLTDHFTPEDIFIFPGYAHGYLHGTETTICVRR